MMSTAAAAPTRIPMMTPKRRQLRCSGLLSGLGNISTHSPLFILYSYWLYQLDIEIASILMQNFRCKCPVLTNYLLSNSNLLAYEGYMANTGHRPPVSSWLSMLGSFDATIWWPKLVRVAADSTIQFPRNWIINSWPARKENNCKPAIAIYHWWCKCRQFWMNNFIRYICYSTILYYP